MREEGLRGNIQRMHLWWSRRALYLHACRRIRSLLLCLCSVFRALINSLCVDYTLTRQGKVEEEGTARERTGNKREYTLTWQGEAEEEGIAGEGDENVAGVPQETGLKSPGQ